MELPMLGRSYPKANAMNLLVEQRRMLMRAPPTLRLLAHDPGRWRLTQRPSLQGREPLRISESQVKNTDLYVALVAEPTTDNVVVVPVVLVEPAMAIALHGRDHATEVTRSRVTGWKRPPPSCGFTIAGAPRLGMRTLPPAVRFPFRVSLLRIGCPLPARRGSLSLTRVLQPNGEVLVALPLPLLREAHTAPQADGVQVHGIVASYKAMVSSRVSVDALPGSLPVTREAGGDPRDQSAKVWHTEAGIRDGIRQAGLVLEFEP